MDALSSHKGLKISSPNVCVYGTHPDTDLHGVAIPATPKRPREGCRPRGSPRLDFDEDQNSSPQMCKRPRSMEIAPGMLPRVNAYETPMKQITRVCESPRAPVKPRLPGPRLSDLARSADTFKRRLDFSDESMSSQCTKASWSDLEVKIMSGGVLGSPRPSSPLETLQMVQPVKIQHGLDFPKPSVRPIVESVPERLAGIGQLMSSIGVLTALLRREPTVLVSRLTTALNLSRAAVSLLPTILPEHFKLTEDGALATTKVDSIVLLRALRAERIRLLSERTH